MKGPNDLDTAHVPDCDRHARCGGCGLMPLHYEAQRVEKLQQFARHWSTAGLPATEIGWVLSDEAPVGYRNRVRCQVTPEGQVRFFNPEKIATCPVLEPSVLAGVDLAQRVALDHPAAMRDVTSLEVRGHDALGTGAVRYRRRLEPEAETLQRAELERVHRELVSAWPAPWLVAGLDDDPIPCQRWYVTRDVWALVPVDAFMQINTAVNRLLVDHVRNGIVQRGAKRFADMFMGSGNFALPLLSEGLEGYAVEAHAGAVRAAVRAAGEQALEFTTADAADAASWALGWVERGLSVDVVIADPPRAGLGAAVVPIAELAASTVVLCSCNFRSLVRDVLALLARGFRVEHVALFDMFPQTPHLESVVWLERERPRAQPSSNIFS